MSECFECRHEREHERSIHELTSSLGGTAGHPPRPPSLDNVSNLTSWNAHSCDHFILVFWRFWFRNSSVSLAWGPNLAVILIVDYLMFDYSYQVERRLEKKLESIATRIERNQSKGASNSAASVPITQATLSKSLTEVHDYRLSLICYSRDAYSI